jgi:hypothetical protein
MTSTHKILHEIQTQLNVPKNQVNKFGGYNYRSCEDILEAVKRLLPEDVFLTLNDELINMGDRFYIKATATLSHPESVSISVSALAREPENRKGMDESQITGSASSYARKYALNGLFCIDDTKDADATNQHKKHSAKEINTEFENLRNEIAFCKSVEQLTAVTQTKEFKESSQMIKENDSAKYNQLRQTHVQTKDRLTKEQEVA